MNLFPPEPITLVEQIACAEREVQQRIRVYARLVLAGKMTQDKSDHEIAAMQAIIGTLRKAYEAEPKPTICPDCLGARRRFNDNGRADGRPCTTCDGAGQVICV